MTSDFDDFMGEAFDDAAEILGTISFTIAGLVGTFAGVLDRYARTEGDQQAGGPIPGLDAQIVAKIAQFPSAPQTGIDLTIGAQTYRIEDVIEDEVSYTIGLKLQVE